MALHAEVYQQEQARVRERFESAVELAEQAFATELQRLTAHLAERLTHRRSPPEGSRFQGPDTPVSKFAALKAWMRRRLTMCLKFQLTRTSTRAAVASAT